MPSQAVGLQVGIVSLGLLIVLCVYYGCHTASSISLANLVGEATLEVGLEVGITVGVGLSAVLDVAMWSCSLIMDWLYTFGKISMISIIPMCTCHFIVWYKRYKYCQEHGGADLSLGIQDGRNQSGQAEMREQIALMGGWQRPGPTRIVFLLKPPSFLHRVCGPEEVGGRCASEICEWLPDFYPLLLLMTFLVHPPFLIEFVRKKIDDPSTWHYRWEDDDVNRNVLMESDDLLYPDTRVWNRGGFIQIVPSGTSIYNFVEIYIYYKRPKDAFATNAFCGFYPNPCN